jgi:hypothetical protein
MKSEVGQKTSGMLIRVLYDNPVTFTESLIDRIITRNNCVDDIRMWQRLTTFSRSDMRINVRTSDLQLNSPCAFMPQLF